MKYWHVMGAKYLAAILAAIICMALSVNNALHAFGIAMIVYLACAILLKRLGATDREALVKGIFQYLATWLCAWILLYLALTGA